MNTETALTFILAFQLGYLFGFMSIAILMLKEINNDK